MGQNATLRNILVAQLGDQADTDSYRGRIETLKVENNEAIKPGYFVSRGSTDSEIKIPDGAGNEIVGVTVNGGRRVLDQDTGLPKDYGQNDKIGVAVEGVWYVYTEEAAALGAKVFVRHTASGGNPVLGTVRTDDDVAKALAINAKFAETVTAAGIVKVKLLMAQV